MLMVEYVVCKRKTIETYLHEANNTLYLHAVNQNNGENRSPMEEAWHCLWLALIRLDCGHRSIHWSTVSMIEIDPKMWGRSRIDRAKWRFVLHVIFYFTRVNTINVYKVYTLVGIYMSKNGTLIKWDKCTQGVYISEKSIGTAPKKKGVLAWIFTESKE